MWLQFWFQQNWLLNKVVKLFFLSIALPTKFNHVAHFIFSIWSCDQNLVALWFLWEKFITSILQWFDQKTFFEWWSWFKFNTLGLVVSVAFKFYKSVAKVIKLKMRTFWGLNPAFGEANREKDGTKTQSW